MNQSTTHQFSDRHIGPNADDIDVMLQTLKLENLETLADRAVPKSIQFGRALQLENLETALSEQEALERLKTYANQNIVNRNYIGMGYYGTITPSVIQRNILENPGWYTQYTPYQAEIAQGRLEALLNFQTMVMSLTGLPVANASLLDEATAAAEAMALCWAQVKQNVAKNTLFVDECCHPQTIEVIRTRAKPLGVRVVVADVLTATPQDDWCGAVVSYPGSDGSIRNIENFISNIHAKDALVTVVTDLLALTLLKEPGAIGADICVGSAQRFGVPFGYGGPHAAFMAVRDELKRQIPGRIVGLSQDVDGKPAARLALQTREQHIRREKATSNICTAQVLLAVMASMYAVYHGPKGLTAIAKRVRDRTAALALGLEMLGFVRVNRSFFDTITVNVTRDEQNQIQVLSVERGINLRYQDTSSALTVGLSLDETTTTKDLQELLEIFSRVKKVRLDIPVSELQQRASRSIPRELDRASTFLTQKVFNSYHSETEMLRYIRRLESRDLSLTTSMIPLGSCTMKLNATSEMLPVTWPAFAQIHPFAPTKQTQGYQKLFNDLELWLSEITGFAAVSLQPNAGSQGEYAGLLVIAKYHESRGESHRNICLIPQSAHGTNPASAVMAGMQVIVVACNTSGDIDLTDLKAKAEQYSKNLAAVMVTYPSTHGVYEAGIVEICRIVHAHGGQVYLDGANLNAQVGLCRPGDFGADVCHLNLHKTFCIPHGGGGPGMGPIGVAQHLAAFLPSHPIIKTGGEAAVGAVSAAPWGSASILPISWMYIAMMGAEGLKRATQVAILNANYMAQRLEPYYPVLYRGESGLVAHECIIDLRKIKTTSGVEVEDVAKRLMDYGYHAPTVSFPVAGTMMIEPTESESKAELDRFCDAMIAIRHEIQAIEDGRSDKLNNALKNAPHTVEQVTSDQWSRPYSRQQAAFPVSADGQTKFNTEFKFWPRVGRINGALGDRNLVCSCEPLESYLN